MDTTDWFIAARKCQIPAKELMGLMLVIESIHAAHVGNQTFLAKKDRA